MPYYRGRGYGLEAWAVLVAALWAALAIGRALARFFAGAA
jgi:hypothetical protein